MSYKKVDELVDYFPLGRVSRWTVLAYMKNHLGFSALGTRTVGGSALLWKHGSDSVCVVNQASLKSKEYDYVGTGLKIPQNEEEWKESAIQLAKDKDFIWK